MGSDIAANQPGRGSREDTRWYVPAFPITGVGEFLAQERSRLAGIESARLVGGIVAELGDPETEDAWRDSTMRLVFLVKALREQWARGIGQELAERYPYPLDKKRYALAAALHRKGEIAVDPETLLAQAEVRETIAWQAAEQSWDELLRDVFRNPWPDGLRHDAAFEKRLNKSAEQAVGLADRSPEKHDSIDQELSSYRAVPTSSTGVRAADVTAWDSWVSDRREQREELRATLLVILRRLRKRFRGEKRRLITVVVRHADDLIDSKGELNVLKTAERIGWSRYRVKSRWEVIQAAAQEFLGEI